MKRWLWYLAGLLIVAAFGKLPFSGTDVAELQPVEVIRVWSGHGLVGVETDTGDSGQGMDVASAIEDLKASTAGQVFLETAEHLIVTEEALPLLPELAEYMRPACTICLESGSADLEAAAGFLGAHEPEMKFRDFTAGENAIPTLLTQEGRMHLVP